VVPGVVEAIKFATEDKCRRIADYAFEFCVLNNRKKLTAVHKANIMKLTDGLFLRVCREVSKKYPQV
jgi:isocitrate dehydrogenase (NAD+)